MASSVRNIEEWVKGVELEKPFFASGEMAIMPMGPSAADWSGASSPSSQSTKITPLSRLYLTSTRLALDILRQGRGVPLDDLTVEPRAPLASPVDVVAARKAIRVLCKDVPGDEIEAALRARVDGLSQPEVAAVLGISERTVRRLLDRFDEHGTALRSEVLS